MLHPSPPSLGIARILRAACKFRRAHTAKQRTLTFVNSTKALLALSAMYLCSAAHPTLAQAPGPNSAYVNKNPTEPKSNARAATVGKNLQ